jgi:hypothetical protein
MVSNLLKGAWIGLRQLSMHFFPDRPTKSFVTHNLKTWRGTNNAPLPSGEILYEHSSMQSSIIAYSYLANILSNKYNATVRPYIIVNNASLLYRAYYYFLRESEKIYKSFGTGKPLIVCVSPADHQRAQELFRELHPKLKNKRDIEKLEVGGVLFGDLIYDDYLKQSLVPTIDIHVAGFISHLKQFLGLVVYWNRYFDTHDIKAVHVSHCVYKMAIVARLAISRDIPAFQSNGTHVYRMNRRQLNAYTDFLHYHEVFKKLPGAIRGAGIEEARRRLKRRFAGEVGLDMNYSEKSAFSGIQHELLLEKSDRKKILIASHCFFDSPHPYGINFFPDFYEWITFLGHLSETTNYDWYIKTHPDFLPANKPIIQHFLKKYPKFNLLPSDASHHQLITEGIDVALTVYGTIGFEYAALGVPVINGSSVNPHSQCNFNINPKDVAEYKSILENLGAIQLDINEIEIYEYYFMHNIYNTNNWLFDNYDQMEKDLGGYQNQFTSRVYSYFLDKRTPEKHQEIINTLETFIDSGDFRLNTIHMKASNK